MVIVAAQVYLHHARRRGDHEEQGGAGEEGTSPKRLVAYGFIALLLGGLAAYVMSGGSPAG